MWNFSNGSSLMAVRSRGRVRSIWRRMQCMPKSGASGANHIPFHGRVAAEVTVIQGYTPSEAIVDAERSSFGGRIAWIGILVSLLR